jgi:general secretion pathway protein L
MEPAGHGLMLAEIFAWWVSQMRALLRGLLGPALAQDGLIVAIDRLGGDALPHGTLLLRSRGQERRLRGLDAPGTVPTGLPVLLRLPPNCLLSRELTLPLAAARDLQAVLRFEMDRLTPFNADELFWGVATQSQDRAQELLRLRLAIVPRAPVTALLGWLAGQKLVPGWIEHADGRIPLNAGAPRPRRQAMLNGLCAALALGCLTLPFIRQQMALNEAAAVVAERAPAAHVAEGLRAQLAAAASGRAAVAAARRQGDALQILAALTQALPDDTWLADLSLKSGNLTMDGQSGNAAKLIALLTAVPGLRDPGFTAPVTRTNDGKADLFSLRAGVAE